METAEQTLQHRNAEVQAVQQKLDNLNLDFERKTKLLIEEQQADIRVALVPLKAEFAGIESTIAGQQVTLDTNGEAIHGQQDRMMDLETAVSGKLAELHTAETDLATAKAATMRAVTEKQKLQGEKDQTSTDIAALELRIQPLRDEIEDLEMIKTQAEALTAKLEADYTEKTEAKEAQIRILDAKILENTQIIEAQAQEELLTRRDMANRQKSLEEKDQNLRIRELKVEQGEGKLVKNSNLLNL